MWVDQNSVWVMSDKCIVRAWLNCFAMQSRQAISVHVEENVGTEENWAIRSPKIINIRSIWFSRGPVSGYKLLRVPSPRGCDISEHRELFGLTKPQVLLRERYGFVMPIWMWFLSGWTVETWEYEPYQRLYLYLWLDDSAWWGKLRMGRSGSLVSFIST